MLRLREPLSIFLIKSKGTKPFGKYTSRAPPFWLNTLTCKYCLTWNKTWNLLKVQSINMIKVLIRSTKQYKEIFLLIIFYYCKNISGWKRNKHNRLFYRSKKMLHVLVKIWISYIWPYDLRLMAFDFIIFAATNSFQFFILFQNFFPKMLNIHNMSFSAWRDTK